MSENNQAAIGTELGNKISVRSFDWTKEEIQRRLLNDKETDLFLMRVIGQATGLKEYTAKGKGDNGSDLEGYGIRGTFEAQGPDGEVIPGALVYLPGYITDQMADALMSGDDVTLDVALDIYARYDSKSATSYVFVGRSLIQQTNSRLNALKDRVKGLSLPGGAAPAALEAPAGRAKRA